MRIVKFLLMSAAAFFLMAAHAAVPAAVEKVALEMAKDGVDVRAGSTKDIGVFVVARGSAQITGTKARARAVARVNAQQNMASFLGTSVENVTKNAYSEDSVNDKAQVKEFFSSVTETKVKELLKGVQDLSSEADGDDMIVTIYLTTKATDKTAELQNAINAMGDSRAVKAIGEGKTHDIAVQLALRSAVEQVVGTMVVGETKLADDELMRNKIFSGAEGFVDEYRITAECSIEIGMRVEIVANVSKKKILDSYRVHLKTLGDPVFYLKCTSTDSSAEDSQVAARFGQFFRKLGFKISKTAEGADFIIEARGAYRRVESPMNPDEVYTQYSMVIKVLSKTGEELLSLPNNPRKSAVCLKDPEREREICAEKAFKQMEKPVHEAIHAMVSRMMADHRDKLMNSDDTSK